MSLLPVGISGEEAGYQIERSLRFNSADSAYLNRTFTDGNRKTFTASVWVKLTAFGGTGFRPFLSCTNSGGTKDEYFILGTNADQYVWIYSRTGGTDYYARTSAVFRDPSAWYHFVFTVDTTQATSTNRFKIYVNGELAPIGASVYPTLNYDLPYVNQSGKVGYIGPYFDGAQGTFYLNAYVTEYNFIDGSALDPTSFGEFNTDTGVWQPKAYTGSYGTNGFYLNFSDNSGTTSTTLGKDYSGNGNNWTPNNFSVTAGAGNDSLVDTPTPYGTDTGLGGECRGNYAIINPINGAGTALTISNGNLDFGTSSSNYGLNVCSMSIKDKTYFEITLGSSSVGSGKNSYCGIGSFGSANSYSTAAYLGSQAFSWSLGYSNTTAYISNNGTQSTQSGTIANGDVFMYAVDPANGSIWFGRNGTWYAGNPSAGTGASYTNLPTEVFPVVQAYNSSTHSINFGQRPFAYTAPSGFKALCTQNLPEPTIVDGGQYFNTVLYTGIGGPQSVTGVGFQPDFVWFKRRNLAAENSLHDAVRGVRYILASDTTGAELDRPTYVTSFDSDGFTFGGNVSNYNASGSTYVAWNWKANGAGVSNTDGTITSTVSANTDSGFSIVTYTGTGANATVGHGLGAVPSMIIVKNRDAADAWQVYHAANTANPETDYLVLNTTAATADNANRWNDTLPTSTVFSIGNGVEVNTNTEDYVAYCFAPVNGYSAMSSFTGNGSADGPFVYTGFRPAWVMIKRTDTTSNWIICDSTRNPTNAVNLGLYANLSNAESTSTRYDFLSNGFKMRSTLSESNASGGTYIYMAFAENPFKISLAR